MPRKVMAGKDTMTAAGTVTKKLVKWLAEKGYVEDEETLEMAEDRCQVGWDISGVAVKTSKGWRLMEVWNVTP